MKRSTNEYFTNREYLDVYFEIRYIYVNSNESYYGVKYAFCCLDMEVIREKVPISKLLKIDHESLFDEFISDAIPIKIPLTVYL